MDEPIEFEYKKHLYLLSGLVGVHTACIEHDNMIATFLPPLDRKRMTEFWEGYANSPNHTIIVQLVDQRVAGCVVLAATSTETTPFNANVLKLLVSPDHRRLGIARRVMLKLEDIAEQRGLTVLMLDTETESPANQVYPRLGWRELGTVPKATVSPNGRRLMDETYYYKLLPSHEARWGPKS